MGRKHQFDPPSATAAIRLYPTFTEIPSASATPRQRPFSRDSSTDTIGQLRPYFELTHSGR